MFLTSTLDGNGHRHTVAAVSQRKLDLVPIGYEVRMGSRDEQDAVEKRKICDPARIEPRFSVCIARSLMTIPSEAI
jgi:hypothetical protein